MHVNNLFYASKLEKEVQKYKLIKQQKKLFCFAFLFFYFLCMKFIGIYLGIFLLDFFFLKVQIHECIKWTYEIWTHAILFFF